MKNQVFGTAVVLCLASACASAPQKSAETPSPATPEAPPVAAVEPIPPAPPPAPAEPTPEEKAKQQAAAELASERAQMEAEHQAEVARLTPEIHAEAKALAEKSYPNGKAAITAALAGKHRNPKNVERDGQRHPLETLQFFGFKPTMTVLEYGPGEGWYTELLAPALAAKGKLLATNGDPSGPADSRATFYAQRFQHFLERVPEAYGKVETVKIDGKAPALPQDDTARRKSVSFCVSCLPQFDRSS